MLFSFRTSFLIIFSPSFRRAVFVTLFASSASLPLQRDRQKPPNEMTENCVCHQLVFIVLCLSLKFARLRQQIHRQTALICKHSNALQAYSNPLAERWKTSWKLVAHPTIWRPIVQPAWRGLCLLNDFANRATGTPCQSPD